MIFDKIKSAKIKCVSVPCGMRNTHEAQNEYKNIKLRFANKVSILYHREGLVLPFRSGYPGISNLRGANHKDPVRQVL